MKLGHYAQSSIDNYKSCLASFLVYFNATHREPKEITEHDVKVFLLTLRSPSQMKQFKGMLRIFFKKIIGQKRKLDTLPPQRGETILPEIFSREEVQDVIRAIPNIKHKALIAFIYSTGTRISEPVNLRLTDVHSKESAAHIRGAKGHKDRIVPIPANVMKILIDYYKRHRPTTYFFEGAGGGKYSKGSIRAIFKRACRKAGVKRKVKVHTLRHSFATHHIEDGTSDSVLMELMGWNNAKTILVYKHLSRKFLSSYASPASRMQF